MTRRAYELLLRLYPRDLQALFSDEMSAVFQTAAEERRGEGWAAFARFVAGELCGLAGGAAAEWCARLCETTRRQPPTEALDLTKMRPAGVSRETYSAAVDEVIEARRQVELALTRMKAALARQEFTEARFHSQEDQRAREHLRGVLRKYNVAE